MMGQQERTESMFYYFRLEDQIPEDHLLRLIDQYVDLSFVRAAEAFLQFDWSALDRSRGAAAPFADWLSIRDY